MLSKACKAAIGTLRNSRQEPRRSGEGVHCSPPNGWLISELYSIRERHCTPPPPLLVYVHHGSKCSQAASVEVFLLAGVAHAESIIYFSELAVVEWARWLAARWSMRSCVRSFFYRAQTRLAWCGDAFKVFLKKKKKISSEGPNLLPVNLPAIFPSCIKT